MSSNLANGTTRSCGCLKLESIAATGHANVKHGNYYHPLFKRWKEIISRCTDRECEAFKNYGGRGITVCDRWLKFENFAADMGLPEDPKLTIDRRENDCGYSPENCRWADRFTQNSNTRSNVLYQFYGEMVPLTNVARRTGIPYTTLRSRIEVGMSLSEAVSKCKLRTQRIVQ